MSYGQGSNKLGGRKRSWASIRKSLTGDRCERSDFAGLSKAADKALQKELNAIRNSTKRKKSK